METVALMEAVERVGAWAVEKAVEVIEAAAEREERAA